MKKILFFLLFFIPATTLSAQIIADVHAGYTPMKGLVGVEIQYWRLSLSAAWWPTLNFTTYPIAGTYYFNTHTGIEYLDDGLSYLSAGCSVKNVYHWKGFYESKSRDKESDSWMILVGHRFCLNKAEPSYRFCNRLYVDFGVGCYTAKTYFRKIEDFSRIGKYVKIDMFVEIQLVYNFSGNLSLRSHFK